MEGKFTPDYEHFLRNPTLRHNVYEPEADTFLFLDGIDAEVEPILARLIGRLRDRAWAALSAPPPTSLPPPSQSQATASEEGPSPSSSSASASPPLPSSSTDAVPPRPAPFSAVEIGCGSGLVITHLGMTLQRALVGWSRGALRAASEAEAAAAAVAQQGNGGADAAMHHLPPPPPVEDIVIARSVMAAVHGSISDNPSASSLPLLAPPFADFYFVDINPLALKAASETWGINLSAQMRVLRGLTSGDARKEANNAEGEAAEGNSLAPVTMLTEGGEPAWCRLPRAELRRWWCCHSFRVPF